MRTLDGYVPGMPGPQGLYDPTLESDACGVGFVVNINGFKSHKVSIYKLVGHLERAGVGGEGYAYIVHQ